LAERADPGGIDPDREALLGVLVRHRVAFVLIGGAAIQSHGRRFDTQDIDLTPDTAPENLARLANALNELGCQLITDPVDLGSWVTLPSDYFTPRSLLAASVWNLATRHGQLDLCFTPTGFPGGYRDLEPRATGTRSRRNDRNRVRRRARRYPRVEAPSGSTKGPRVSTTERGTRALIALRTHRRAVS
jgi:hypothetical protein